MAYPKNAVSPPKLFATVVKAADGTAIAAAVAAKYSTGAGSQAAGGGTCQHEGNGQWSYAPTQAETNVDAFGIQFYHADAVGSGPTVSVVTTASVVQTGDSYAIVSNATYGNSALETLVDGLEADTTEILTRIPDATPGANGGLPTVNASNYVAGIAGTKNTFDSLNDLAAQAIADALKLAPTAGDPAAGSVNKHLDDLITGVADVPTNSELTTALNGLNDITVADIIAGIAEGSLDLQEILRIILAAVAGKASGGGTTSIAFRDQADSKNRIAMTVDSSGNRSVVSVDGS